MRNTTTMLVLANGCFDLFHVGHARYLKSARQMGSSLCVAVTDDAHVNKGDGRPLYDQYERLEVVRAVRWVLDARVFANVIEAFEHYKPAIFAKGREYEHRIEREHEDYCKAHGIEIRFTDTETVRPRDRLRSKDLTDEELDRKYSDPSLDRYC